MYLIVKHGRVVGYASVDYSSDDPEEMVVEVDDSELRALLGDDWSDRYGLLVYDNGVFSVAETQD